MHTRRDFLIAAAATTVAAACSPSRATGAQRDDGPSTGALPMNPPTKTGHYHPPHRLGLGGVAIGTGFAPLAGA